MKQDKTKNKDTTMSHQDNIELGLKIGITASILAIIGGLLTTITAYTSTLTPTDVVGMCVNTLFTF